MLVSLIVGLARLVESSAQQSAAPTAQQSSAARIALLAQMDSPEATISDFAGE